MKWVKLYLLLSLQMVVTYYKVWVAAYMVESYLLGSLQ